MFRRRSRHPWGPALAALFAAALIAVVLVMPRLDGTARTDGSPDPTSTPREHSIGDRVPASAQPTAFVYSGDPRGATAYAEPGGLVVAGRDNYRDPAFRTVAEAGGTVLVYLDPMIKNSYGRYHQLLFDESSCGPAVPDWPGSPSNSWGRITDTRPGAVVQLKLECVLETMVRENPHMGGWFADDLGSRPWGTAYTSWPRVEQQEYYDGAVAISQVFRRVADEHGLIFITNGTWEAGDVGGTGGGFPDRTKHGNSLADGGVIEYHDGQQDYFGPYGCSQQWAADSLSSAHHPVILTISRSDADRDRYAATGCVTHAVNQSEYLDPPPPWGLFKDIGLPSGVGKP
ncbi:hypothetical protein EV383_4809 [Pseudonocardia sediminis]|uniref:Uncharacterized protein n=1 Tax=Pseudonocardia sediminis TaxID=1397368 RepID=A0A4Q7V0A7_PSEST|nr:hypothetical protein [Pseudonocardia sediminis]RZT87877.1 hypothetical protein EV383_4809 [Pseudonocardia sediminis]